MIKFIKQKVHLLVNAYQVSNGISFRPIENSRIVPLSYIVFIGLIKIIFLEFFLSLKIFVYAKKCEIKNSGYKRQELGNY